MTDQLVVTADNETLAPTGYVLSAAPGGLTPDEVRLLDAWVRSI
jgi:hypothetical protein